MHEAQAEERVLARGEVTGQPLGQRARREERVAEGHHRTPLIATTSTAASPAPSRGRQLAGSEGRWVVPRPPAPRAA